MNKQLEFIIKVTGNIWKINTTAIFAWCSRRPWAKPLGGGEGLVAPLVNELN
jgi:hypothetical protein